MGNDGLCPTLEDSIRQGFGFVFGDRSDVREDARRDEKRLHPGGSLLFYLILRLQLRALYGFV